MQPIVNVLLDSFPGLSLPPTVCLPLPASCTAAELLDTIAALLPSSLLQSNRLVITSTSNRPIYASSTTTVADLSASSSCRQTSSTAILPLRLSASLIGGKGGFGSQLRAAGGRMSSRKKRQNAELATGSARNLDGRRLRTITEAKNLATYLATKPEMDRKEKEERRKRWEQIIELAEQREADMRAGKGPDGRRKGLSDEWVEEKEEVGENVRNAVKAAMLAEQGQEKHAELSTQDAESSGSGGSATGSGGSATGSGDDSDAEDLMELDEDEMARLRMEAEAGDADAIWVLQHKLNIPSHLLPKPKQPIRRFAGFDDEEDDISSSEDDEAQQRHGKGKQKDDSA
ncbi:hypothetical protein HRR83_000039 [Exophiala dermatitidis]|uniref:Sde2 N-terminal ubiquitin domain-containing protein n=1 Tax=Exophiala dermatitidis TaxID=5970 RepID=A0AAN6F4A5_EXODE|nr:hypothetical protein HRR73_002573 [Exophiala dermatitidis]KAJ4527288.1 hypothetical protein HRR74_000040 [Exophiala dermatitidis]KAJ4530841.1 hypothetical protein HRR76_008535 [Exophiala dermatitidis]KAJ4558013.1 hypothetical protein HRR77_000040 [Exophiala dermatitidis]KAJ4581958.1 hypothetical protein HRR79_000958 [Exophiala dermatitidis]